MSARAFAAIAGIVVMTTMSNATSVRQERAVTSDATREPVIGLLNIPDVVAGGCGPEQPSRLDVLDAPLGALVQGSVTLRVKGRSSDGSSCEAADVVLSSSGNGSEEDVPTEESDAEVRALIVYERSGEWFRIALNDGSGWVHADPQNFLQYPDLLINRLAYVRKGWDGTLWREPGGVAAMVPETWTTHLGDDLNAEVLSVRRVGKQRWIHVRLVTESCGQILPGLQPVTGWIRAYDSSGRPAAWFYSRGC
jgi:hypothetical protein